MCTPGFGLIFAACYSLISLLPLCPADFRPRQMVWFQHLLKHIQYPHLLGKPMNDTLACASAMWLINYRT